LISTSGSIANALRRLGGRVLGDHLGQPHGPAERLLDPIGDAAGAAHLVVVALELIGPKSVAALGDR
jgi:hypothetical protein